MSLFSRNTGGRRMARLAAVFAGTLLTYLVVTAVPAFAVATACTVSGLASPDETLTVQVGTDASVVFALNSGDIAGGVGADVLTAAFASGKYIISVDGGPWSACDGGTAAVVTDIGLIKVLGTNDGVETFNFFRPTGANALTGGVNSGGDWVSGLQVDATVDLGNGSDSLVIGYGALSPCPVNSVAGVCGDPATSDSSAWGTGADGSTVADLNATTLADLRVDNAENITMDGGGGADTLDAGSSVGIGGRTGGASPLPGTAVDDIQPAAVCSALVQGIKLNGGTGDDTLFSGLGNDTILGAAGVDAASYVCSPDGVTADLAAGTATGMGSDTLSDVQDLTGSDNDDTLTGNALDNTITGGLGDDTLAGGAGDDTVMGGAGDDTINEDAAANGSDILSGGAGGPEVVGDTLNYGARTTAIVVKADGVSAVSGASGEFDTVGTDFENYITGSGNDTLTGNGSPESFDPGSGINTVVGGAGPGDNLDLSSQTGPAAIILSLGAGTATAGTTVDTYSGIESFTGTSADDTLTWDGTGALLAFNGMGGVDTIDASSATADVVIALPLTTENAIGGSGNDTLTGNASNNMLIGNDGNDTISSGTGNDFVEGGLGNDVMIDGGGADVLSFRHASSGETIDTANGFASGGDGEDSLTGIWETVLGSDFADNITGGQSSVDVPNRLLGFAGNDVITGTNSTDTLRGGSGDDQLRGGGGDDTLAGSGGNDKLYGSNGDDTLRGGAGTDWGWGGAGADSCYSIAFQNSC